MIDGRDKPSECRRGATGTTCPGSASSWDSWEMPKGLRERQQDGLHQPQPVVSLSQKPGKVGTATKAPSPSEDDAKPWRKQFWRWVTTGMSCGRMPGAKQSVAEGAAAPRSAPCETLLGSVSSPQISSPVCFQGQQWAKDRDRLAATEFPRDVREGLMQFTPSPFLVWFLLHPPRLPVAALPWPGLSWSDRAHCLPGSLPGEGQALAPS